MTKSSINLYLLVKWQWFKNEFLKKNKALQDKIRRRY